jgi:hypothetical protein
MAIDFPASPTLNDVFTVGNVTYVWDGTKWTASVTGGISLDKIEEGNTSAEVIDTGSDGRFVVTTEGTERLRVTDTGRVGIGTASPNGNTNYGSLDLNGSAGGEIFFSSGGVSRGNIFNYSATPANLGIAATDASGQIIFNTGGYTERVRIDSAGRVGIGTSSPSSLLHLGGTASPNVRLESSSGPYSLISSNTVGSLVFEADAGNTGASSNMSFLVDGTSAIRIASSGNVGIGTTSPAWPLDVNGIAKVKQAVLFEAANSTNRWDLYTNTDDTFRFNYNGSGNDEITITSGGNVGIGAPPASWDPDAGLSAIQLNGYGAIWNYYNNVQLAFNTYQSSTGDKYLTAGKAAKYTLDSGGDHVWYTAGSGSANAAATFGERARIDNSGRLLVGTSSAPTGGTYAINSLISVKGFAGSSTGVGIFNISGGMAASSVVSGTEISVIACSDASGNEYATIKCVGDGTGTSGDYPGRLVFSTTADGASSPTERMRIGSAGQILLGCSTAPNPGAGGGTDNGWAVNGTGSDAYVTAKQDNSPTGYFRRDGTDGDIFLFYKGSSAVGSISVTAAATAYNTSSDYRLKKNVTPVIDGITRLQQLKPSRFNFIADPDTVVDGFLAHEVQTIVPEAITGEKDAVDDEGNPEYQGIDQSKLVPLLTAALQEAIGRIETLEGMVAVNNITIDEQQHQLSTLAARLTALESA